MAARMGGFNPGPWGSGGWTTFHDRRYRLWHVRLADAPLDGRLIDVSWGIVICDRVSPRGTMHILDHVPQLRVATY